MRPELIIFDCDGVLIDSEGIASALIAREMTALGWQMDDDEARAVFLGMSIIDMEPLIEIRLGRNLPKGWRAKIAGELVAALGRGVTVIPGAKEMLERVNTLGIDWRVASNSSLEEMAVKFASTRMSVLTAGKCFAAGDLVAQGGRPKPAPDVFLAAAGNLAPSRCLVLEDSALGVTGAVAAGMTCFGFDPHGDGAALLAAGAVSVLHDLRELFEVLE